jgi:hypothetical protein
MSRGAATVGSRPSSAIRTTPPFRDLLATQCAALSKVHRAYAGRIHARGKRTGHFRQGRFGCVAMDEPQQSHVP